jgi:hypothetical protein
MSKLLERKSLRARVVEPQIKIYKSNCIKFWPFVSTVKDLVEREEKKKSIAHQYSHIKLMYRNPTIAIPTEEVGEKKGCYISSY